MLYASDNGLVGRVRTVNARKVGEVSGGKSWIRKKEWVSNADRRIVTGKATKYLVQRQVGC